MHAITVIDAAGKIERFEWFDDEDFDAALARLDELGAADPRTPFAENARTRLQARVYELLLAGRLDDARALFADDYVRIDRRTGRLDADAWASKASATGRSSPISVSPRSTSTRSPSAATGSP